MSTHSMCFRGEIRKILCGYPLLSVAMDAHVRCFKSLTRAAFNYVRRLRLLRLVLKVFDGR